MKKIITCRDSKVRELKKNFDSLTNNVVIQLNSINRLLKELEQER